MILRIFKQSYSECEGTTAYMDVECSEWEVIGPVLVITRDVGRRHYPLNNVLAFEELGGE